MSNFSIGEHAWRSRISQKLRKENIKKPTIAEDILYKCLKQELKGKSAVMRQKVCFTEKSFIIADLYLRKYKVAIEIDGGYHELALQKIKDMEKNNIYKLRNYKLLRFSNIEVINNTENVVDKILSIV